MRRTARVVIAVLVFAGVGAAMLTHVGAPPGRPTRDRAAFREPPRHDRAVTVRWSQAVRGWPSQLTADRDGVVAVSGGRFVSSFALADGSLLWETEVEGPLHSSMPPAIDARAVLVSAGDRFVLLDRHDGVIRWEAPAVDAGGHVGDGAGGVALVTTRTPGVGTVTTAVTAGPLGTLTGRDGATGSVRWSITFAGSIDGRLAAHGADGAVVAVWRDAAAATVGVVDVVSGVIRWEREVEPRAGSPAVAGDLVVVAAGDGDYSASVRAFARADGTIRWATAVPASFEADLVPGFADAGTAAGVVGVQDVHGTVTLLDLRTGAVRWRTSTRVPALHGRLLITSDAVVVRNEGQELVVLDRRRGRVVDRRSDPEGLPEGTAAVGDRVLVGWRWATPGRIDAVAIEISRSGP